MAALCALLLLLPFEPRRALVHAFGLQLTLLEAVAGMTAAVLLAAHRDRLRGLLRRPPPPLAFLWSYAAVQFLSAALAPMNRVLALKFALRMAAAAVLALAVAATPRDLLRRALPALTVSAAVVAVLALLEGARVTALDPFLDSFRLGPFWIGLSRRASAGSESPNLAAAILVYGLVPGVGLASLRPQAWRVVVPVTALLAAGLLFTYSRGGLLALATALATLCLALAWKRSSAARAAAAALSTMLVAAALFTVAARTTALDPNRISGLAGRAARYVPAATFLSFAPRESRTVAITVTNTGRMPWTAATLGCTWQRADAERTIDWAATAHCPFTAVPAVAPGDSVRLDAAVRAPIGEGRYLLVWDLAADGWIMSSAGVPPATVPVVVSLTPDAAQPFSVTVPPAHWERGRAALWRTALALWRERPIVGIGPDNFRWAHGAYAGWPRGVTQDTLVTASNMFLETAATTGLLGLLALLGTLAATARAALEALARAPADSADAVCAAVWLALVLGIAAHGLVDTFLGFTGHYLFLALVVGAASSAIRPESISGIISAPTPGLAAGAC